MAIDENEDTKPEGEQATRSDRPTSKKAKSKRSTEPKPVESKPAEPRPVGKGPNITDEDRRRELAKKADPHGPLMNALLTHPNGLDPRIAAAQAGMAGERYSEALTLLNALVFAGYARRIGRLYQATPAGALARNE